MSFFVILRGIQTVICSDFSRVCSGFWACESREFKLTSQTSLRVDKLLVIKKNLVPMLLCLSLQVDKLTSQQVDKLLVIKETPCSYVTLSSFTINLLTCPLVASSTYLVTLSLFGVDELDEFTSKQVACYKGNPLFLCYSVSLCS